VADYVKAKMEQVWHGNGGVVGMVDHGDSANLVQYLESNAVPATYSSVAATAKGYAQEADAYWDSLPAGTTPTKWAYTRNLTDNSLPYCVLRFYKLVTPDDKKDYFPILAHEICHYILYPSENLIEADTRDFLFDPAVADADKPLGAKARNRFIQEILGRRLNYLVHKEIDTGAQRRNQVGIWLQNFWSKVTIYDNVTFANKVRDDFNFAGEFLKKASDATYAAEAENGIH
jgi:hypothetical protein